MKIHPVGAELFHVGRQMDRQTWKSSYLLFANFVNAPKKTMGTFQHLYQFPELKSFIFLEG